jgi:hypothetical protein
MKKNLPLSFIILTLVIALYAPHQHGRAKNDGYAE